MDTKNTLKSKKRVVQEYMVFGIGLLFLFVFITSFSNKKNSIMTKANQNSVVAHRGAWKLAGLPQNSIASLKQAITLGCVGSEFDVRMTADGHLVVNHDADFHGLDIEKTNYNNLLVYTLSNGEKIPTLAEYIQTGMENNPGTRLVCEIKPSEISKERGLLIAEKAVNLVNSLKGGFMVDYISFDYDILKKIKEIEPEHKFSF
ncbi:MAG: glycerophosphodiester phosphodiesterase family protein [Flavobacteriaceae bacterium]|nr:glycerophosphodiester phosphodiesterase family protein [Flavobacteriaceae bacterium]